MTSAKSWKLTKKARNKFKSTFSNHAILMQTLMRNKYGHQTYQKRMMTMLENAFLLFNFVYILVYILRQVIILHRSFIQCFS